MIKLTLILSLIPFLVFSEPKKFNPTIDEISELRKDISLLNLLNGLYLTDKQAREILTLAINAKQLKEDYLKENSSLIQEEKKAFNELKNLS